MTSGTQAPLKVESLRGSGTPTPPPVVLAFAQADLVASVYPAIHNFGQAYVLCQVYDDTGAVVVPDDQSVIDVNTLALLLSSYEPIAGTWHAVIVG